MQAAIERDDDNVRLILTGYTDAKDLIKCINQGLIYRYLTKPWDPAELKAVLDQALLKLQRERTLKKLVLSRF